MLLRKHSYLLGGGALVALVALGSIGMPRSFGLGAGSPGLAIHAPRVVVLKSARQLFLYDGDHLIRTYAIDLGDDPMGDKRIGTDHRTPEGRFRICTKNANSEYHRFLGVDYPGEDATIRGLRFGWISPGEASQIRQAHRRNSCPPWTTALGGGVGLHGHRLGRDWTAGCIALDNQAIDELFAVLRIGDPIEILP